MNQRRFVRTIIEDLEHVREQCESRVGEPDVRRLSAVLRRLLIDSDLRKAWKLLGFEKEPKLQAPTLGPLLKTYPLKRVLLAWAGGALAQGQGSGNVKVAEMYSLEPESGVDVEDEPLPPMERPWPELGLRRFMEEPSVIVRGKKIPRRVVLKFVANKMGGAHFDEDVGKGSEAELYRLLDEYAWLGQGLDGRPMLSCEVMSIAQALVESADLAQLRDRYDERRTRKRV